MPITALSALMAAAIFLFDLAIPLGVAGGVPYVAVVLVSLRSRARHVPYTVAVACSALSMLGYF